MEYKLKRRENVTIELKISVEDMAELIDELDGVSEPATQGLRNILLEIYDSLEGSY